jgi:hypothetical protein
MGNMERYKIYGLKVESEMQFPEIKKSSFDKPEVSIFFGKIEEPNNYGERKYVLESSVRNKKYDKYYMKGVGGFASKEGKEIKIDPEEGAEKKGFRFLVLGLAMGLILEQRGTITFHASAVDLGRESVAFAGPKRAGKSTTAAAFHAAGYSVITDDLLPVSLENGRAYSIRGFPHLKLNPQSASLFGEKKFKKSHIIDPKSSKKLYSPEGSSINYKMPLRTLYILDRQEGIEKCKSEKLNGVNSLKYIINSIYSFQMKKEVSQVVAERCMKLAKNVEVKLLKRPNSMGNPKKIVKLVSEKIYKS